MIQFMMQKRFALLLFILFGLAQVALAQPVATTKREVTPVSPAEYFQTRLTRLMVAIEDSNPGKMVAYQRDLVSAMREYIIDVEKTGATPEQNPRLARLTAIFHQFDNFSFHNAPKADVEAKLVLMEEFLDLMQ
jgi:hypothetical protein